MEWKDSSIDLPQFLDRQSDYICSHRYYNLYCECEHIIRPSAKMPVLNLSQQRLVAEGRMNESIRLASFKVDKMTGLPDVQRVILSRQR